MLLSGAREAPKTTVANVAFVRNNGVWRPGTRKFQAINETLLTLSEPTADRLIGLSVLSSCRQLTTPSNLGLVRYRLITYEPISLGAAGKIIGYSLYANGSRIGQEWLLLFKLRLPKTSSVQVKRRARIR